MMNYKVMLVVAFVMPGMVCGAAGIESSEHKKIGLVICEFQELLSKGKTDCEMQKREMFLDEIRASEHAKDLGVLHAHSPRILNEGSPSEVRMLLDNLDPQTIIYQPFYWGAIVHHLALRSLNRREIKDGEIAAILRSRLQHPEVRRTLTFSDQRGNIPFFAVKKAIGFQKPCSQEEAYYYTELLKLLAPDVKGLYLEARTIASELASDDPSIFNQARNDYYSLPSKLKALVREQFIFVRPNINNFDTYLMKDYSVEQVLDTCMLSHADDAGAVRWLNYLVKGDYERKAEIRRADLNKLLLKIFCQQHLSMVRIDALLKLGANPGEPVVLEHGPIGPIALGKNHRHGRWGVWGGGPLR